jgi:hypothetical protein
MKRERSKIRMVATVAGMAALLIVGVHITKTAWRLTQARAASAAGTAVSSNVGDFLVYASEAVDLRDRTTANGNVGSNSAVQIGADGRVVGFIQSGNSVLLRDRARVQGNVTAGGAITRQSGTVVTGIVAPNTPVPSITIPTQTVTPGSNNVTVSPGQTSSIAPGSYNEVHIFGGATVTLRAGTYSVKRFIVEAGAANTNLNLDVTAGAISLKVLEQLSLGDRTKLNLLGDSVSSLFTVYSHQTTLLRIGTDSIFVGRLTAPRAEVSVASRTTFRGRLFARRVGVEPDTRLNYEQDLPASTPILTTPTGSPGFTPRSAGTVIRSRPVLIDVATIRGLRNQVLRLNMFPDASLSVVGVRLERFAQGFVWMGRIVGQPGSLVALSIRNQVVSGTIFTDNGKLFQILFAGNGIHVARETNRSSYRPDEIQPGVPNDPSGVFEDCGGTETAESIDAMVLYSTSVKNALGGTDAAEARVYESVALANESYRNSGINQRLRLVHTAEEVYTESGSMQTDRDRLKATADGFMDDVHTQRDIHGADVVGLLIDSGSGIAYIMSTVALSFENSAFMVVQYDRSVTTFSLAHEFGHVMGARHDRVQDPTENMPYAYNHGFVKEDKGWVTVMAYQSTCTSTTCSRIQYFSNPDVTFNGDATGVAEGTTGAADNRKTLNNTAPTVANFRCSSPRTSNVWMRDTWDDAGEQPDSRTVSQNMWESPYIWVRNSQDPNFDQQHRHQNPLFGATNYVYVKLHNGATTPQSGQLEIYWADASTNLSWPSGWTLLGSINVSGLGGRSTRILEQQWTNLPGTGHFCLLARWNSAADPMAVTETTDINANVRANNNLVWKNVNIVSAGADETADFNFNLHTSPGTHSLTVGPTPDERNGSFLLYGTVRIRLPQAVLNSWVANGRRGTGISFDAATGIITVTDPIGGRLDGFAVQGAAAVYPVTITVTRPAQTPTRAFHLQANELGATQVPNPDVVVSDADLRLLGGVTYELLP